MRRPGRICDEDRNGASEGEQMQGNPEQRSHQIGALMTAAHAAESARSRWLIARAELPLEPRDERLLRDAVADAEIVLIEVARRTSSRFPRFVPLDAAR